MRKWLSLVACLSLFAAFITVGTSAAFAASTPATDQTSCVNSGGTWAYSPETDTQYCDTSAAESASCSGGSFLGFPKWYEYLPGQHYQEREDGSPVDSDSTAPIVDRCTPRLDGLNDIWRIVAAALDILLRVGALIAIGFVVYGGVTYTLSQGSPDKTKQALKTIISALVGLVISIVAVALVTFVAGRF